jgi:hypothetical protein
MWSALSHEKSGLYFSDSAGHRQRSFSQIYIPNVIVVFIVIVFRFSS